MKKQTKGNEGEGKIRQKKHAGVRGGNRERFTQSGGHFDIRMVMRDLMGAISIKNGRGQREKDVVKLLGSPAGLHQKRRASHGRCTREWRRSFDGIKLLPPGGNMGGRHKGRGKKRQFNAWEKQTGGEA